MSSGSLSERVRLPFLSVPRRRDVVSVRAIVIVLALVVLGAVLRCVGLGHQGFWFDEGNTALLVHFSPGRMLGLIPHSESTPPLYYCVAWVWARVFGYGEVGLRLLSAVAGVLTVPVAFAAGRELAGVRAGVIAAALTACNPLLIWYSQEARSYALLTLFCALSLWAFARVRKRPEGRVVAAWALVSALSLATHYYAAVAVVPQAIWLLAEHRRVRAVQLGVALVGACGVALIPLALSQDHAGHDSWIGSAPLRLRLAQIIPQFLIGTGAPARTALKFLGFAMALTGLGLLVLRGRGEERRAALAPLALAVGGFALSLVFAGAGRDALITRNILPLWLPAAVVVAGGLAVRRPRAVGLLAAAALCAIGVAATVGVSTDWKLQRPDWRLVARVLGPQPAPGSARIILIQRYKTLLPLSLYLPHLRAVGRGGVTRANEFDVISMKSPKQRFCWWGAACNLISSQLQRTYAVAGFHAVWTGHVRQFTVMRLVAPRPVTVTSAEVSRALHTTTLRRDELLVQR